MKFIQGQLSLSEEPQRALELYILVNFAPYNALSIIALLCIKNNELFIGFSHFLWECLL